VLVFESVSSPSSSLTIRFDPSAVFGMDALPSPRTRRRGGGVEDRGVKWMVIGCTLIPRSRSLHHPSEAMEMAVGFAMNDRMARSTIHARTGHGRRLRRKSALARQTTGRASGAGSVLRREA
jgi:hypothetical protein